MSDSGFERTMSPFTVLVFATRKPGTTFEEFRSYYENHHVPLVRRILQGENSFQSYTRHYVDRRVDGTFPFGNEDKFLYDCVARSEYLDRQAWEKTLKVFKEHIQEIDADEKKFLDQSKMMIVIPGEGPGDVAKR